MEKKSDYLTSGQDLHEDPYGYDEQRSCVSVCQKGLSFVISCGAEKVRNEPYLTNAALFTNGRKRGKADMPWRRRYTATMNSIEILPYSSAHKDAVLALTVDAWTPVFSKTQNDVPRFVLEAFYPNGWEARQTSEVDELLQNEPENIWLAVLENTLVGFIGLRLHPEDQMGEIYIIAVSPDHQRRGISTALMKHAEDKIRKSGAKMIMVETIGDSGHEPARHAYEAFGFKRWPVARYFKEL